MTPRDLINAKHIALEASLETSRKDDGNEAFVTEVSDLLVILTEKLGSAEAAEALVAQKVRERKARYAVLN